MNIKKLIELMDETENQILMITTLESILKQTKLFIFFTGLLMINYIIRKDADPLISILYTIPFIVSIIHFVKTKIKELKLAKMINMKPEDIDMKMAISKSIKNLKDTALMQDNSYLNQLYEEIEKNMLNPKN